MAKYDLNYIDTLIDYIYKQYNNDPLIVFKSCQIEWIVILKKLSDTITNESRSSAIDIQHAKYRGNKFLVIDIVNKFNINNHINEITNSNANVNGNNDKKKNTCNFQIHQI